jgi:uncharacterized protein YndB with AHSA1/START domain
MTADRPKTSAAKLSDREICIVRTFNAPRERVWEAWTDPLQLATWWGPEGFTLIIHEMDVRPGGLLNGDMLGPDGTQYLLHCVFTEVIEPSRIVYQLTGGRKDKADSHALVTWTFEDVEGKTRLTLHMLYPDADACRRSIEVLGAVKGGNETLGRLEEHVRSRQSASTSGNLASSAGRI